MAEAIVGPLLSKLQEVVVAEAKVLAGVGDAIDSLRDKLMWLHALLHEIEQRRHDNSRFREVLAWQIREVASQAEDAIDRFHLRADLSRRGHTRAVVFILNLYTQIQVRFSLSGEIESMNARLEEIINNSGKYGTVYGGPDSQKDDKSWKQSAIRSEWLWQNSAPFEMIGRKRENEELKEKLTKRIQHSDRPVAAIYIVGDSGMGKTTFLRSAYKDAEIRKHFDACISVSFPPSMSKIGIVNQIKKQLDSYRTGVNKSNSDPCSFLVWINSQISMTKWKSVEDELSSTVVGGTNYKITIMISATSSHKWMESDSIIKLEHLDQKDSLALFDCILSPWICRTSNHIKSGIKGVQDNIKDITNGLPLAVVTLAKFMIAMDNYNKWETASNYTMNKINDDKLKVILLVSIDDLPDEIKQCMLYTAGFPENTVIDAKQLVRLWAAEGFLSPQHGMEAEQLGQCYLKELIHRGLLLDKASHVDGVHHVAIHDLLHRILRSEGHRRSFMHVHCSGGVAAPDNTRRLALQNNHNTLVDVGGRYRKLRTVLSFCRNYMDDDSCLRKEANGIIPGCDEPTSQGRQINYKPMRDDGGNGMHLLLKGSPYLRVINLEGQDILEVPDEIGDMVHLRYLGLRCRSLTEIPESIGKLGRLETLDVRGANVRDLPGQFWKIQTLLHVLGDGLNLPDPHTTVADRLFYSRKRKGRKSADMPASLQTLESVTIRHVKHWKERLRSLHRLHFVGIKVSDGDDLRAILVDLSSLQSLSLSVGSLMDDAISVGWLIAGNDGDAHAGSQNLLEHLTSLELEGTLWPGARTINGSTDLICLLNLTRLVLRSTRIGQSFIDVIAKLHALAELELHKDSYEGEEVVFCAQGFRSLEELWFSGLFQLKKIRGPEKRTRWMSRITTLMDMGSVQFETHKKCKFCESRPDVGNTTAAEDNLQTNATQPTAGSSHEIPEEHSSSQQPAVSAANPVSATSSNVLREMVKTAINNGSKNKTAIEKYIRSVSGDPLVLLLEQIEQRKELESMIQRGHKIYFADPPPSKQPTKLFEKIRAVIDKDGSTKTAISVNFKKEYGVDPLSVLLDEMVEEKILNRAMKRNYMQYSVPS